MNKNYKELIPELRFPDFKNKGEWVKDILVNVASFSKGKGVSKKDIVSDGKLFCIRYGELYTIYNEVIDKVLSRTNLAEDELILSKGNEVIIPSSGETQIDIARASCVLREGIALGGDLNIIQSKMNCIYLSYYLNGPKKREIAQMAQGVSVMHLYNSQLQNLEIEIPAPKEQQKIASCLASLDSVITTETKKLHLLKDHKKGLLQQLFPAEGETQPQFRFPEFVNDGDFNVMNLGVVCDYFNGASNEKNVVDEGQYFLISLNSIDIEGNLKPDMKRVNELDNSLMKNDLVMVLSDVAHGNFLGLSAIIPSNNYVLNQRMAGLRLKEKDINIQYLRLFINNNQKYFKRKGQGSSQQNLSKPSVENFPVLLPTNPLEQQKIAKCLSSVDDLIKSQDQKIDNLKAHKKGLMQQLFPNVNELVV